MIKRLRVVHRKKKFGVLTADGKEFLPFVYDKIFPDDVWNFFELHKDGMVGFCAYDGTELLPLSFEAKDVSVNREARMFEVKRGYKTAFYNFNGKLILDAKHPSDAIKAYSDGFVIRFANVCRFVNLKGDTIISGYDEIYEVSDYNQNVLKVKKGCKYGVFDLAANEIMPVRYDDVRIEHGVCKGMDTVCL